MALQKENRGKVVRIAREIVSEGEGCKIPITDRIDYVDTRCLFWMIHREQRYVFSK